MRKPKSKEMSGMKTKQVGDSKLTVDLPTGETSTKPAKVQAQASDSTNITINKKNPSA